MSAETTPAPSAEASVDVSANLAEVHGHIAKAAERRAARRTT